MFLYLDRYLCIILRLIPETDNRNIYRILNIRLILYISMQIKNINPFSIKQVTLNVIDSRTKKVKNTYIIPSNKSKPVLGGNKFDVFDENITEIQQESNTLVKPVSYGFRQYESINTIREKIQLSTFIPIFRQHLVIDNRPTYTITLNDIFISFDIFKLEGYTNIVNIPVDNNMFDNKDYVSIETIEFKTLVRDLENTTIEIVDLYDILPPSSDRISEFINDLYMSEMLYYGFILKFFPQISLHMFYQIYRKEVMLYPYLNPNMSVLSKKYENEYALVNELELNYAKMSTYLEKEEHVQIVEEMHIRTYVNNVNIRNLFDGFSLEKYPDVRYVVAVVRHSGNIYKLTKMSNVYETIESKYIEEDYDNMSIYLNKNIEIHYTTDIYSVHTHYHTHDRITYDDALVDIKKIANLYNPGNFVYVLTKLSLQTRFPCNMTTQDYTNFYENLRKYELIDMFERNIAKDSDSITCKVGVIESDNSQFRYIFRKYGVFSYDNEYAIYIDPSYRSKFLNNVYKTLHLQHLVSGISISFKNITKSEYDMISNIVNTIIFLYNSTINTHTNVINTSRLSDKNIKKLQEIDPNLFNFRKYDPDTDVYAVRCQSDRQPTLYRENEIKDKKNLVKFKNFTTNENVYYACENPKFPTLIFKPQIHPLHYCVPCCKKLTAKMNSLSSKIDNICMKKFQLLDEEIEEISSIDRNLHASLTYGKFIPIGRISDISNVIKNHFLTDNNSYNLYGVEQNIGTLDVSSVYSLMYALNLDLETFIRNILNNIEMKIEKLTITYNVNYIKDAIVSTYLEKTSKYTFNDMNKIMNMLIAITYNIHIIIIQPEDIIMEEYVEINLMYDIPCRYVILIKHQNGTYPLIRTYKDGTIFAVYNKDDTPIQTIANIVKNSKHDNDTISATSMYSFLSKHTEYRLDTILVGNKSTVYAYILEREKSLIYVPISYTTYVQNTNEMNVKISNDVDVNAIEFATVLQFLKDYSNKLIITHQLVYKGEAVASCVNTQTTHGFAMIFYHKPTRPQYKQVLVQYDIWEINKLISHGHKNEEFIRENVYSYIYSNHLYRLFLVEFNYIIQQESDSETRTKVEDMLSKSTINRTSLQKILEKYPKDYEEIINLMKMYPKNKLIKIVKTSAFDMDNILITKLLNLKKTERKKQLTELMMSRVEFVNKNIEMSNIYTSCKYPQSVDSPQCNNSKLMMRESDFYTHIDILLDDIEKPLRYNAIHMFKSNIVNFLKFTKRVGEYVKIEYL